MRIDVDHAGDAADIEQLATLGGTPDKAPFALARRAISI